MTRDPAGGDDAPATAPADAEAREPAAPPRRHPGVVPGSIGDLSIRLGRDVRELIMDGTDLSEIHAMIAERQRRRGRPAGDG